MKKTKEIAILSLVILFLLTFLNFSLAHEVELDPDNLISFPMMVVGGKGKITIDNSQQNYSLYYQTVILEDEVYDNIQNIMDEGQAELNKLEENINSLNAEVEELKNVYNEKYDAYKKLLEDGVEGEELETAKTAYEESKTNYDNKIEEYNSKIDEYNAKGKEIIKERDKLVPMYEENNWGQTTDGSFDLDLSDYSGRKSVVLWVKLVTTEGTEVYDETIYTVEGTKEDEINVESVVLSKTELSLNVGNTYTLVATVTPGNATNKSLKWSSSNEKVATVENGIVRAISEGTTTITVKTVDGGYTATCEVIVTKGSSTGKDEPEIPEKDDPTIIPDKKLPQTGDKAYIIILAVAVLAGIVFIAYRGHKKNKF